MPYTKRLVIRQPKGVERAKKYVDDEEKTMYEENINRETSYVGNEIKTKNLVTGINCSSTYADKEFLENAKKYNNENDDRQAYHLIQSFKYDDPVSAEQVHEMGIELAKQLYPNYQCLVATHTDKGHLHNHILINATSLSGKKLRDDFYGEEGLMAIREASDKIAKNYHCKIIEDAPPIGKYKGVQAYMNNSIKENWKNKIKNKIESLKPLCSSLDELLEMLSNEGYVIKNGKHIAVRPFGMQDFKRLDSLGVGFSQKELNYYFKFKQQNYIDEKDLATYNLQVCNELGKDFYNRILKLQEGIIYSQKALKQNNKYPKYYYSRSKDIQKLEELKENLTLLNKFNINSFSDLDKSLKQSKALLSEKMQEYQNYRTENEKLQSKKVLVTTYLKYYNQYMNYLESQKFEHTNMPEEIKLFLDVKKQLGNIDLDEARKLLLDIKEMNMKTNQIFSELTYLKYENKRLEQIKINAFEENKSFIRSVSISKKMIDETKSNDAYYYIRLPYTDQYTYVLKDSVCWYGDNRAQLYLVDDDTYDIYNKDGTKKMTVHSEDLQLISDVGKEKYSKLYKDLNR